MTISARLVTLLIILAFGVLMASVVGYDQPKPWKKTLGYPLYSAFKQGLTTLQFLLAQSLTLATRTIQSALGRIRIANF